jgi:hypothetical protein
VRFRVEFDSYVRPVDTAKPMTLPRDIDMQPATAGNE